MRQQSDILELQTTIAKQQLTSNQHQETIQRQEKAIRHHDNLLSDLRNRENKHKDVVATLKSTVMIQRRQIKRLSSQLASTEKIPKTSVNIQKSMPAKVLGASKFSQKQTDVTPIPEPESKDNDSVCFKYLIVVVMPIFYLFP